MKSRKRACDNIQCGNEEFPENESKPYVAPYHWIDVKGIIVGEARFSVEVCGLQCLAPAIELAIERE